MTKTKKIKKQQLPVGSKTQDELQITDAFDEFLFNATNYIYKKRKIFIGLGVVFLVILLGGYGINWFIESQNNLRNEGLFKIESAMRDNKLTDQEKYDKALPIVNTFLEKYEGTKQSEIALFYRGSLYFQQKKYVEAEKDLRSILGLLERSSDFYVLASIYLSNILRDQEKTDKAIEILESAKTETMTDVVMMEIAETYISIGKKAEAQTILQAIVKGYPNSMYKSRANQLLASL